MSDSVPQTETGTEPGATEPGAEPGPGVPGDAAGASRPDDPAAPAPLHVPRTPTGNAEVDARLARLADAGHLATDGHVEVYEDVHRGLREVLSALDTRPEAPPPAPQ